MNTGKKIVLSASSLNLFIECPRCFWLEQNKKLKRPRGPFPSIAIGLDSIVKKYFDNYRRTEQLPPLLGEKLKGRLIDFLPKSLWYNLPPLSASLLGKLDECIVDEEGYYLALDHKTRSSSPSSIHGAFQLQLDIYTLLLLKNNFKTRNIGFLVYYIPEEGLLHQGFPFKVEIKKITTNPERAEEIFRKAVGILRQDLPQASENCEYCNWLAQNKLFL